MCRHYGTVGFVVVIAAFSLLAASACGGARSSGGSPSSSGAPHVFDPETGATLAGTVLSFDFGQVRLHAYRHHEVRIRNDGSGALHGTVVVDSPDTIPKVFSCSPSGFYLGPGDDTALSLEFLPTALGERAGSLRLVFDRDDSAAVTFRLRGTGVHGDSPEIEVAPEILDYGPVALGTYVVRRLTIRNVGADIAGTTQDNLRVSADMLRGVDAADFSVLGPPDSDGPEGLAAGEYAEVLVRFEPKTSGTKSARLEVRSNDPYLDRLLVDVTAVAMELPPCNFEVRPPAVAFGTLAPGAPSQTLTFAVVNRDTNPTNTCRIAGLDLTPATKRAGAFVLPDGPLANVALTAGDSLLVHVGFQPQAEGTFDGSVIFYVSQPAQPQVTVPLSGYGRASCVNVAPSVLDFGEVGLNCSDVRKTVVVTNNCSGPIDLTAMDVQQASPSLEFTAHRPALPLRIEPAAQANVEVGYTPANIGDDSGSLALAFGTDGPTLVVSLIARALDNHGQIDVFSQSDAPRVDILFVVDNSSSMADKQALLASNFAAFVQSAEVMQHLVDWHIGVTTTDATATGEAGRLLPPTGTDPRVLTLMTPNFAQLFAQRVAVGSSGSETESLLRPAYLALSDPLLTGDNDGFYRDEARLAVIIVSDAADQDATPLSVYSNFFYNLKGTKRRSDFSFSAIIPTLTQAPTGCTYDTPTAGQDTRVAQFVRTTGGLVDDICSPNWANTLSRLGRVLFPIRTTFFLSNTPDLNGPDPIVIVVDNGPPLPQYAADGTKHWDYVAESNAVVFEMAAVPPPGSTLTINYRVACHYPQP